MMFRRLNFLKCSGVNPDSTQTNLKANREKANCEPTSATFAEYLSKVFLEITSVQY